MPVPPTDRRFRIRQFDRMARPFDLLIQREMSQRLERDLQMRACAKGILAAILRVPVYGLPGSMATVRMIFLRQEIYVNCGWIPQLMLRRRDPTQTPCDVVK